MTDVQAIVNTEDASSECMNNQTQPPQQNGLVESNTTCDEMSSGDAGSNPNDTAPSDPGQTPTNGFISSEECPPGENTEVKESKQELTKHTQNMTDDNVENDMGDQINDSQNEQNIHTATTMVQPDDKQGEDKEKASDSDDKSSMTLDSIKSMIDNINLDINTLKSSSDINKAEHNEEDASTGAEGTGQKEINFDALRMRNDQLRQELLAIKKGQELRGPVTASVTEQKIIESAKMNKLKDSTCSLETEIEIINKARKAQESLRLRQEERREAERKKRREENKDMGPVSVEDIKVSIQQLKKQMEDVSNFPISEIDHSTPVSDETIDSEESKKEQEEVKSKNKKAHEDMLKKYLLATVMKQNIDTLTKKMNDMLAEQGIKPVTASDLPAKVEGAANQNERKDETNKKEENDETDEFYMYEDEQEGNNSDLYEEDCQGVENDKGESETLENDKEFNEIQKRKESVLAAAAKSISDVEALIYKDKDNKQEPANTSHSSSNQQASNLSKSQKKKLKRRQAAQTNTTKQQEVSQNPPAKSSETKEDKPDDNDTGSTISIKKIRTYNLLLKLQREMGSMQLQVSKLQDNMRAVNSALQEILNTEFDDM